MTKFADRSKDLSTDSGAALKAFLTSIDIIEDKLASKGAASFAIIPVNIDWDRKFDRPNKKPRYVLKMRRSEGQLRFHLGSRDEETGETKWELLVTQDIKILMNVCQVIPNFYLAVMTTHPVQQKWDQIELLAFMKHLVQGENDVKRNSLPGQIEKLKKLAAKDQSK